MEHPRLVSVAEQLVPNLVKPKSKTGCKLFTKLEELKVNQKRGEGKEEEENSEEGRGKDLVKQPKQKQMAKKSDQINPAKRANGKKRETKAETANTTEVDKTPTECAVATVSKNKQTDRKGEGDMRD